jgi:hypothetical protein
MPLARRQASLRNSLLDPQLGPKIKTEPNLRPSTPGLMPSYDMTEGQRSFTAPMHGWGSLPYGPSPSQAGTSNSYASDADDDDDDDDASSYGYAPRVTRRRKMSDETISWHGSLSGSLTGSVHVSEEQDPMDVPSDMARLKGDIWPGMDIFDSATPEMRRKRNQKKATSVIVQLQATSKIVTPTELIFDNLGQFKKERVISGEPNSADSPLRGETTPEPDEPPVKKRATRRRPRAALADKDPNGGRALRSNRRDGSHHPGFGKSRPQYVDGSDDLDEDDIMTYGQQRPAQRRSGLSIHRDIPWLTPEWKIREHRCGPYQLSASRRRLLSSGGTAVRPRSAQTICCWIQGSGDLLPASEGSFDIRWPRAPARVPSQPHRLQRRPAWQQQLPAIPASLHVKQFSIDKHSIVHP